MTSPRASGAPRAKATPTDRGFRVTGRWPFCSGQRVTEMLGLRYEEGGG
jgi:hypothetical protein